MYYDKKRDRVLLRDGRSIVSPVQFSRLVLKGEDVSSLFVIDSDDSRKYDLVFGEKTSSEIEDVDVSPHSHVHSEEELTRLLDLVISSDRFEDMMIERLEQEVDFFDRTNNVTFLLQCVDLLEKMQQDGVVYGVGRGSMCASLVLYLLKVHDINPLQYDIPFSEFSKEQEEI